MEMTSRPCCVSGVIGPGLLRWAMPEMAPLERPHLSESMVVSPPDNATIQDRPRLSDARRGALTWSLARLSIPLAWSLAYLSVLLHFHPLPYDKSISVIQYTTQSRQSRPHHSQQQSWG